MSLSSKTSKKTNNAYKKLTCPPDCSMRCSRLALTGMMGIMNRAKYVIQNAETTIKTISTDTSRICFQRGQRSHSALCGGTTWRRRYETVAPKKRYTTAMRAIFIVTDKTWFRTDGMALMPVFFIV